MPMVEYIITGFSVSVVKNKNLNCEFLSLFSKADRSNYIVENKNNWTSNINWLSIGFTENVTDDSDGIFQNLLEVSS